MRNGFLVLLGCFWVAAVWAKSVAATEGPEPVSAQTLVDYDTQVHPILAETCLPCHSQEKRSGGLSLATYRDTLDGGRSGAAINPGSSSRSLIISRLTGEIEPAMPMGKAPLSAEKLAMIRAWIDQGARATPTAAAARPKWEAPLALERPVIPDPAWRTWTAPLDRFVAVYLVQQGVAEPRLVPDAVYARRVYLDVWGLLPTPGELQAFVADASPDKRSRLVERLLADSTKYSEHWISFWNDLLRNEEGGNYYSETASRKTITPWLLSALRSNLPYDQLVSKLLNPVAADDPDGFLVGVNWRGVVSASQTPAMQAAQNTAQIFLGLNIKCSSCHDSFINRWKLKDAYALAGFFSPEARLQLYRCDVAQPQHTEPAFLFGELNRVPPSDALADRRATAAAIFTDRRNGRLARTLVNRVWHRFFGAGLVEHPDEMDGEPWSPALLDWMAADFVERGYNIKRLIVTILSSRAYQLPAVARTAQPSRVYAFRGPEIRRLTAEQFADAIGSLTGDWQIYQPPLRPAGAASADSNAAMPPPGIYTRNWRVAASSLTRALGRPIRDQVYSTRESQATTLQALELVNGETLTHWLMRGARRMLGELPPAPTSLFTAPLSARGDGEKPTPASFDLDVSNAARLWLIVQDTGSTAIDKAEVAWQRAELIGPTGVMALSSLKPLDDSQLRAPIGSARPSEHSFDGVRVKTPSRLVYDISDRGFTRFRGTVGVENVATLERGENLQGRFLIFDEEPDMDRLVPPGPHTPLPEGPTLTTVPEVVDRVFWYLLGRAPTPEERHIADGALRDPGRPGRPSAEGLADLLWAVMMKPEFQLIF